MSLSNRNAVCQTQVTDFHPENPSDRDPQYADDPVAAFPVDALPAGSALRNVVTSAAEVYNIPIGRAALAALSALSAAAGKGLEGQCRGRTVRSNMMAFVVAASGDRKSASSDDIWRPIRAYTTFQRNIFRERQRGLKYEFDKKNQDIRKRVGSADADTRPTPEELRDLDELERRCKPPVYVSDDATTPALLRSMYFNNGCITVASTDAVKLMANISGEMNQNRVDDSLYLKGFSGDNIAYQRVADDVNMSIPEPWLSFYACFTKVTLSGIIANKLLREDGFLPRILPWFEGSLPARSRLENLHQDRRIPQPVQDSWDEVLVDCLQKYRDYWLRGVDGNDNGWRRLRRDANPHVVDMNDPAVVRQFAHHGDRFDLHGDRIDVALRSFAVRREEYAQRIALLIHMAQHGEHSHKVPMTEWTAWAGCVIDSACYQQWRGLLAEQAEQGLEQEAQTWRGKIVKAGQGVGAPVSIRNVYTKYGMRPDELLAILGRHPQVFEIFKEPAGAQGGRPRTLVRVKPAALDAPGVIPMPELPGGEGYAARG